MMNSLVLKNAGSVASAACRTMTPLTSMYAPRSYASQCGAGVSALVHLDASVERPSFALSPWYALARLESTLASTAARARLRPDSAAGAAPHTSNSGILAIESASHGTVISSLTYRKSLADERVIDVLGFHAGLSI